MPAREHRGRQVPRGWGWRAAPRMWQGLAGLPPKKSPAPRAAGSCCCDGEGKGGEGRRERRERALVWHNPGSCALAQPLWGRTVPTGMGTSHSYCLWCQWGDPGAPGLQAHKQHELWQGSARAGALSSPTWGCRGGGTCPGRQNGAGNRCGEARSRPRHPEASSPQVATRGDLRAHGLLVPGAGLVVPFCSRSVPPAPWGSCPYCAAPPVPPYSPMVPDSVRSPCAQLPGLCLQLGPALASPGSPSPCTVPSGCLSPSPAKKRALCVTATPLKGTSPRPSPPRPPQQHPLAASPSVLRGHGSGAQGWRGGEALQ